MKTINVKELTHQSFPKEVVEAYKSMCEAQVIFNIACAKHAPDPPLKRGDKIVYTNEISNTNHSIVKEVKYRPYSHGRRVGPWFISVKLTDVNFKELWTGNTNNDTLNDKMIIKLIES